MKILLKNKLEDSNIEKISIYLNNERPFVWLHLKNGMRSKQLLNIFLSEFKGRFKHQLLNPIEVQHENGVLTLQYNNMDELFNLPEKLLRTFIHLYPEVNTIDVSPSKTYLTPANRQHIPFKPCFNYKLTYDIDFKRLHNLVHHFDPTIDYLYTEIFVIRDQITLQDLNDEIDAEVLFEQMDFNFDELNRLVEPMYVCYINPIVGYGAFASRDIEEGELVTVYNGQYFKKKDTNKKSSYRFNTDNQFIFSHIDSHQISNLSRFLNNTRDPFALEQAERFQLGKDKIAFENLKVKTIRFNGIKFISFFAKKNIPKHEQLLISYGRKYFRKKKQAFFLKNNDMIDEDGNVIPMASEPPEAVINILKKEVYQEKYKD